MKMITKLAKLLSSCFIAILLQGTYFSAYADSDALYQHAWQLTELNDMGFESDVQPYFLFDEKGNVYGFGVCNYLIGKFKSDISDEFLLTKLKRSNEDCQNDDDEIETKLMAAMLMSNRFEVDDSELRLMSDDQKTLAFAPKHDLDKNALIKAANKVKARIESGQSTRKKGKKVKSKKKTTSINKPGIKKVGKTTAIKTVKYPLKTK